MKLYGFQVYTTDDEELRDQARDGGLPDTISDKVWANIEAAKAAMLADAKETTHDMTDIPPDEDISEHLSTESSEVINAVGMCWMIFTVELG